MAKYGYLYDWRTARNVCPASWHLPIDAEWTKLTDFVGRNPGTRLKVQIGWSRNGNGTDDYGFLALPGGYRGGDSMFYYVGYRGYWWSTTEDSSADAWTRRMYYGNSGVYGYRYNKGWGLSVRCIRDD